MIALSVVKKDAEMLSIGLSWRFSPKSGFGGLKGGPLTLGTCPPNLVVVFTCVNHVPNLRKIGQKIAVAIVDEMFVRTDRHTHTQTYTQVILVSVQCHELHWTDNNLVQFFAPHGILHQMHLSAAQRLNPQGSLQRSLTPQMNIGVHLSLIHI